jgi:ubiquinone/menaquinone biosynthesis C-methylase UbiE
MDRKNASTANHVLLGALKGYFKLSSPMHWADLGCGSGVFTGVLADMLPPGSSITAVDRDHQHLADTMGQDVAVSFQRTDFVIEDLYLSPVDGILMANVLHFVKDKEALIRKLELLFKSQPRFLVVEYDRHQPNPWGPYPAPYDQLTQMFLGLGYGEVRRLGERNSAYGGKMYGAFMARE